MVRRSRAARAAALPRPGAIGIPLDERSAAPAETLWAATTRRSWPSKRKMNARSASHSRTAFSASVSKTGWRSNVDRPITLSSSLVAVCCSSETRSSLLRASSSVNSRTFSMAMTAWSAKVLRSSIWLVGERPRLRAPDRRSRRSARRRGASARRAGVRQPDLARAMRLLDTRGSLAHVLDVRRRARSRIARPETCVAARAHRVRALQASSASARHAVVRRRGGAGSPRSERRRRTSALAQLRARSRHDRVEDRLDVGRRARDDAQDLAGGRLLLERLGEVGVLGLQLGEQPRVLDGDGRLVGEGLHQRDLAVGERPDLVPVDEDRPRAARPPCSIGIASTVRMRVHAASPRRCTRGRPGRRGCGWCAARGRRAPTRAVAPGRDGIPLDEGSELRRRRCGWPRRAAADRRSGR